MSQEQLAFDSELHRTHVSAVERGIRNPTVETLGKSAKALSVRPLHLLDDYDPDENNPILGEDK